MKKICNIYNTPSHYRLKIYSLLDEEYDCVFIFGDDDLHVKCFEIGKLKNARFVRNYHFGKFIFQPSILPYIFNKYDAYIMTPGTNNLSIWFFLLLSKLFSKKKVYLWTHGIYGYESKLKMLIRNAHFKLADGLLIYGDYACRNMINMGYKAEKIYAIHNSLDYDTQLPIRKKINTTGIYADHFGNNYPVLLFIGRLTKVKKLEMLLDSVAKSRGEGKNYNVIFVGDGVEKESLIDRTNQLGLQEQVWFFGACYDEEENARLIHNADLCVAPGNVGLTSIHSLMYGTPVLTHNDFKWQMPEFEVIKEWETGCFFERDNVSDLAKKITEWFNINGHYREKVRKACYEVIDTEWNPHYQMGVIKKILKNL